MGDSSTKEPSTSPLLPRHCRSRNWVPKWIFRTSPCRETLVSQNWFLLQKMVPHSLPRMQAAVLTNLIDDSATDFTKLNARVCILPVLSSTSPIPLHRLSPSHANIRINTSHDSNNDESNPPKHLPTPLYNNALLQTLTPKHYLLSVHNLQNEVPAFTDALALLRIWANQRGYSGGTKWCVRGFEAAGPWWWSLLALLLHGDEPKPGVKLNRRKPVGKGLSSYQLFKAALEFLGTSQCISK